MGKYSDSPDWEDIIPIPQDDGGPNPLAAIAYTEEYSEAMSYLRAVMAKDEKSNRVIRLTEDIVNLNPSHYTVWLYRADNLFMLNKDLLRELEWLDGISFKHLKNYQIWHHRQTVMSHVDALPSNELSFLTRMFAKDVKNYHVWSYRQWLVRHFALWDNELQFVESLLLSDVRNNSAWNHRWFIVFGRHTDPKKQSIRNSDPKSEVSPEILERELSFTKSKITLAPQNQSPWTYLRAVLKKGTHDITDVKVFAEQFADIDAENDVKSSHALDFLADVYDDAGEKDKSGKALELLASRYDPIRKNYWSYRRSLLGLLEV